MLFKDIPQFTRTARYVIDVPFDHVEKTLEHFNETGKLQLDPEFQRAHVWNNERRARYIEYVLRGGKSSRDIYFNQSDWMQRWQAPMYLVDGKQRLEAVRLFMANELVIFGQFKFADFTDRMPFEAAFRFHVNDLKTYADVLRWYLDLNTGGVVHTNEEIEKVKQLLAKETGN